MNVSEVDNLILKAIDLINKDDYASVKEIVHSITSNNKYLYALTKYNWQQIAYINLEIGNVNLASKCYKKSGSKEGLILCMILMNSINDSIDILNKTENSPMRSWLAFLLEVFSGSKTVKEYPTFLMIRHFTEFTVYYLLRYKLQIYLELFKGYVNKLSKINLDIEKFIGYAYFNAGYLNDAIKILNNVLKYDKFNGEVYFKLGHILYIKKDYYNSLAMLQNALLLLPEHYPTKILIGSLNEMLLKQE